MASYYLISKKLIISLAFLFCFFLLFGINTNAEHIDSWMPNKDFQTLIYKNMLNQGINVNSPSSITKTDMSKLKYIRNTFKDNNGKIFHDDLLVNNSSLEIGNYSIEGIQYANNLDELQLSSNLNYCKGPYVGDITDISTLKGLLKLKYISLYGNRIVNISPIINL